MKDSVYMITQLDSQYGYAVGRRIFVLSNEEHFAKVMAKVCTDRSVKGTYTTSKEVVYG